MLYVHHCFAENFINASGSAKTREEMAMDELAKLIANNPVNIVYILRNAGVEMPDKLTQDQLCDKVMLNIKNPYVARNLAALMLVNNEFEDHFSASGTKPKYRKADTSFGVMLSDQNTGTTSENNKSQLGSQVFDALKDEKTQDLIAKTLAGLSTWNQSRKQRKESSSDAADTLKDRAATYSPYRKKSNTTATVLIILGITAAVGTAAFFIVKNR